MNSELSAHIQSAKIEDAVGSLVIAAMTVRGYLQFAYFSYDNRTIQIVAMGFCVISALGAIILNARHRTLLQWMFLAFSCMIAVIFQMTDTGQAIEILLAALIAFSLLGSGINFVAVNLVIFLVLVLGAHAALLSFDVIPSGEIFNRAGEIRMSYGFMHPNSLGLYVLQIILLMQLVSIKRPVAVVLGMSSSMLVYLMTGSRSVLLIGSLFSLLPIVELLVIKIKDRARPVLTGAFPACVLINLALCYFAREPSSILNQMSGYHLLTGYIYLANGIRLLGGNGFIPAAGSQYAWLQSDFETLPLDNMFAFILSQWGLLFVVILCLAWHLFSTSCLKTGGYRLLAAGLVLLVYGFVSMSPVYSSVSVFPLLMFWALYDLAHVKNKKIEDNQPGSIYGKLSRGIVSNCEVNAVLTAGLMLFLILICLMFA